MSINIDIATLDALAKPENLISARELKIILRLGWMRARSIKSKHDGGYRYYEASDTKLSEWELAQSHIELTSKGYVSNSKKFKYHRDGKQEQIFLIDLTKVGIILYFHCKLVTRSGLDVSDLEFLDDLLANGMVFLQNFDSRILLQYIDFIELSEKTGYNISQFARSVLETEEREQALTMVEGLKEAIDASPRQNMSNSDIELLYTLVKNLERELEKPAPRRNVFLARGHILFQVIQYIAVGVGVVAGIVTILQYFGI